MSDRPGPSAPTALYPARSGPDPTSAQRNASLDGIRGFAALAVVFAHFVVFMGLLPYAPLGSMGVVVFFALSGYLIATICWRVPATGRSYATFLRRRVRRLAPVVFALVLVGAPTLVVVGRLPAAAVLRDALVALAQGTAFATASGVGTLEPFLPTWSLTVEWTFYLSFPVLLFGLRRSGMRPGRVVHVLAATAVGLYLAGLVMSPLAFYLLPVANLGVLVAGAALATWHVDGGVRDPRDVDPTRSGMALLLLVLLVALPGASLGWGWKLAVLPASTVCALALVHGSFADAAPARLLAARPLTAIGLRAYSLYVWHVPVMWIVWVNMPGSDAWTRAVVAVVAVAVVTVVSFSLLERPALRRAVEAAAAAERALRE